jgi:nitrite reductase/ring-hydroxylating ferredoxin subunit
VNPAAPPPGTRLCALADLPEVGARRFDFRHEDDMFAAFVVRRGGQVFGYVDYCPHNGWPLAAVEDRYLTREKDLILCGAHGALFRIEDGFCVAGPCADASLTAWPVTVRDGEVFTADALPAPKKRSGFHTLLDRIKRG